MSTEQAVKNILELSDRVQEVGHGFYHTNPLSSATFLDQKLDFGLFDWGMIAAATESPLHLPGKTDRGKTDYATILLTAFFGEQEKGRHKTDIDLDFGSLTYGGDDFGVPLNTPLKTWSNSCSANPLGNSAL